MTTRWGALIAPFDGVHPEIDDSCFVAPGAVLVGAVRLCPGANVWYGCVLRSEGEPITVGRDCNIQDGCILHSDPGHPTTLGDRVTLGHGAIVHGATVDDDALIGIRATVLNGARIGTGSVVAAGAVVREGTDVPPRSLVAGVPARIRRSTGDGEWERIASTPRSYLRKARAHQELVAQVFAKEAQRRPGEVS